jgi:hypothetical protein
MFCICVKKPLPPGDNPIAVNKYYYSYYYISTFLSSPYTGHPGPTGGVEV